MKAHHLKLSRIILASGSPRRKSLLKPHFRLKILVPRTSERTRRGESARNYVERVAREKWHQAVSSLKGLDRRCCVLTADTTVALGSKILGKPRDRRHAEKMLRSLSARTHRVMTSVCVGRPDRKAFVQQTVITEVSFRTLSQTEIDAYLRTQDWKGKAGAYAVQGGAHLFIDRLNGSLTNVIGLPLRESLVLLKRLEAAK